MREVGAKTRDFRSEVAHFLGKVPRFSTQGAGCETMIALGGTKNSRRIAVDGAGVRGMRRRAACGTGISLGVRRVCARCGRE